VIQAVAAPLTPNTFFEHMPDEGRFELCNRVTVKMQPTGSHKQVASFLA